MRDMKDHTFVGLHKVNSPEFVKKLFNLYNDSKIVVFIDDNSSKDSLSDLNLSEIIKPQSGYGWFNQKQAPIHTNNPAQVVYSSGTEGKPKALLISHASLSDVVERLNNVMHVNETIKEYIGVPVTYSFGLGRCRAVAAAGGSFYIPENGFNPVEIQRMLEAGDINSISAVPTLWRMILNNPDSIGTSGSKVKWIEIGSQYMSRKEKEQMKLLFPSAKIIQHYGLTEASRSTFLDISDTEGEHLESVGKAYGEVKVGVSDNNRIMIKGPHIALGTIVDNTIKPVVNDESWLVTNDNGHLTNGYLYFDGRSDDIINLSGIKINPELIQQNIYNNYSFNDHFAICRITDELSGDGIFVAVERDSGLELDVVKKAVLTELSKTGINPSSSLKTQYIDSIPRTETGKVKRKELSKNYTSNIKLSSTDIDDDSVFGVFNKVFPSHDLSNENSFKSLGGDSLNYVQLTMMLEKYLGHLPHKWDNLTINELENTKSNKIHRFSHVETASFLRALAILFIVGTHSGVEILGGGTLLLFFLVGYNFSRFKSDDIIDNKVWPALWSYFKLILIPYYLLTIVYLTWNKSFDIDVILLYANLLEAKITVIFPFWFVQVLLQCFILLALLFSLPVMRNSLKNNPWVFSFSTLIVLICIRAFYPYLWDTSHLNNLVPLRFMAILWLGWCFNYADTTLRKSLLIISAILFALIDTGLDVMSAWLIIGSICMAFVPYLITPHFVNKIIQIVASSTFYIFIFNGVFIYFIIHILKIDSSLLAFIISLVASITIWWLTEYIYINDKLKVLTYFKYKKQKS